MWRLGARERVCPVCGSGGGGLWNHFSVPSQVPGLLLSPRGLSFALFLGKIFPVGLWVVLSMTIIGASCIEYLLDARYLTHIITLNSHNILSRQGEFPRCTDQETETQEG